MKPQITVVLLSTIVLTFNSFAAGTHDKMQDKQKGMEHSENDKMQDDHKGMQHSENDKMHDDHKGMQHSEHDKKLKKTYKGTGVIHSVSKMNRKINLTHDPIPSLKWPKMRMDLDVADNVDLKSIKLGEAIKFQLELGKDKKYRITKIKNYNPKDRKKDSKAKSDSKK